MDLVLFKDAVQYICKIQRVLKQERGHALLVGVGGSGRHSLARLASFIAGCASFEIEVTKSYRITEFREDIKKMNSQVGAMGKPTTFIFSDTQITQEAFLEDLNSILASGEIPNIYNKDEKKNEQNAVRKDCKREYDDKKIK